MKVNDRKPTGVRITIGEKDGKVALFLNRTTKSGSKQNSPHTAIKPIKTQIISDLDPTKIGNAVLNQLGLE